MLVVFTKSSTGQGNHQPRLLRTDIHAEQTGRVKDPLLLAYMACPPPPLRASVSGSRRLPDCCAHRAE